MRIDDTGLRGSCILLEMSCKICQDHAIDLPGQMFKNLIRVILQVLERFFARSL